MTSLISDVYRWIAMNMRYFGNPPWDTNQSPPELLEFIQAHPAGHALDLGCGTGKNCLTLAQAGWKTTGVDIAWKALRKARVRFDEEGLQGDFRTASVLHFNAPDTTFDLVLDIGCYHSLPDESRPIYCERVTRWLKPGGSFLIYAHRNWPGKPDPTRMSEADMAAFSTGLNLVSRKDTTDRMGRETIWLRFEKPAQ